MINLFSAKELQLVTSRRFIVIATQKGLDQRTNSGIYRKVPVTSVFMFVRISAGISTRTYIISECDYFEGDNFNIVEPTQNFGTIIILFYKFKRV